MKIISRRLAGITLAVFGLTACDFSTHRGYWAKDQETPKATEVTPPKNDAPAPKTEPVTQDDTTKKEDGNPPKDAPKPKPGEFDKTFGTDGKVTLAPEAGYTYYPSSSSLAMASDAYYVAGEKIDLNGMPHKAYPYVLKFDLQGKPVAYTDLSDLPTKLGVNSAEIHKLLWHGDGLYLLGEYVKGADESDFVIRLKEDGSFDNAFGVKGMTNHQRGPNDDPVTDFSIDDNGRILLTYSQNADIAAVRLDDHGKLDPLFGNALIASPDDEDFGLISATSDDGAVVAGQSRPAGKDPMLFLARLDKKGKPVASFGTNGVLQEKSPELAFSRPSKILVQKDQKILIVGNIMLSKVLSSPYLARYGSDGKLDASFGTNGILKPNSGYTATAILDAILEDDGSVFLSGQSTNDPNVGFNYTIMRLTPDGKLDESFGEKGLLAGPLEKDVGESIVKMETDDQGRIIALLVKRQIDPATLKKIASLALIRFYKD